MLELNADSPVFAALKTAVDTGDTAKVEKYAKLLYGQAAMMAGLSIEDPAEFIDNARDIFPDTDIAEDGMTITLQYP